ncbi:MAG TPA: hypothetical protein VFW87_09305 [Pirellulales bacterium]|nr:hypothetical protein [Pirellulales bacterium]
MIVYQPDDRWNVVDLLLMTDLEAIPVGMAGEALVVGFRPSQAAPPPFPDHGSP